MVDVHKVNLLVGKRIREIRESKKLTQEKLALEAGLNRAYIGYIERGERNPSVQTIARIANCMNVRIKDFFDF